MFRNPFKLVLSSAYLMKEAKTLCVQYCYVYSLSQAVIKAQSVELVAYFWNVFVSTNCQADFSFCSVNAN